jgi:hypothetical protein
MQAGMDECLQQLADLQQNVGSNESDLQEQIDKLESQQAFKLNEILGKTV